MSLRACLSRAFDRIPVVSAPSHHYTLCVDPSFGIVNIHQNGRVTKIDQFFKHLMIIAHSDALHRIKPSFIIEQSKLAPEHFKAS